MLVPVLDIVRLCRQGNEKRATARSVKSALERQRQLEEALTLYKQITAQLDLPVVCNQFAQARFFKGRRPSSATSSRRPGSSKVHVLVRLRTA